MSEEKNNSKPEKKKYVRKYRKTTTISAPEAKKVLPFDVKNLNLTNKELRFIALYCTNGGNKVSAVRGAGYKAKKANYANSIGCDLLNKPKVIVAIKKFFEMIINPFKEKLEWMLLEVTWKRAFFDINMFYQSDGNLKPLDEIPEEWRVCVDGVTTRFYGKDANVKVTEYKIADRDKSLKELFSVVYRKFGLDVEENIPEKKREMIKKIWEDAYKDGNIKVLPFKNPEFKIVKKG